MGAGRGLSFGRASLLVRQVSTDFELNRLSGAFNALNADAPDTDFGLLDPQRARRLERAAILHASRAGEVDVHLLRVFAGADGYDIEGLCTLGDLEGLGPPLGQADVGRPFGS